MNERLTIVLLDGIGGLAAVVLALPLLGAFDPVLAPVVAVAAAGTGWILYQADRDGFESPGRELAAYGLLLSAVVALGGVLFTVAGAGPVAVARAALLGGGVTLVSYRLVYGVVRPVPEPRLERQRERSF